MGVRGIAQPLLELFGLDSVQHIRGGPSLARADLVAVVAIYVIAW